MAGLDDLFSQINVPEIASSLGADEGEVNSAVQSVVPLLLTGLQEGSQSEEHADSIATFASTAARGLLDAGAGESAGDVGHQAVAALFGDNNTDQVAAALAKGGAGSSDLLKKLLPILVPIVMAYVGKKLDSHGGSAAAEKPGGVLGDVLGGILGGGSNSNNALGSILGGMLGGGSKGGALGGILGGLFGGKK